MSLNTMHYIIDLQVALHHSQMALTHDVALKAPAPWWPQVEITKLEVCLGLDAELDINMPVYC
jgi:hypothetical protein